MERQALIDVSYLWPIQTILEDIKIAQFVCGNISTFSVVKRYQHISLSISKSEPRSFTGTGLRFHLYLLL